jgi:hypothetical protein
MRQALKDRIPHCARSANLAQLQALIQLRLLNDGEGQLHASLVDLESIRVDFWVRDVIWFRSCEPANMTGIGDLAEPHEHDVDCRASLRI